MTTFTIGEIARRVGLKPSALRYYEGIGLLPEPERISGRRVYDEAVFRQVAGIQLAKQAGFTLDEIALLMDEQTAGSYAGRWQQLAEHKLQELDALIASAQLMKARLAEGLACQCEALTDCELILNHNLSC